MSALRRLMTDAREGGPAKVDALLALAQRTVFVVPWPKLEDGWRTLVSSNGESALPIFSDRAELEAAALRFGWVGPDGKPPSLEVGSRETLRYARDRNLSYVVVDIAAEHSIEITPAEMEPLLSPAARRESTGPFSGAGRVSSTLMRAVRSTPSPMKAQGGIEPPRMDGRTPEPTPRMSSPQVPVALPAPLPGQTPSSPGTLAASSAPLVILPSIRLGPALGTIEDALLDRLDAVLRDYPEVEFGCVGSHSGRNALGLRLDLRMRKRLDALALDLGKAAPPGVEVVLLDDADHFKAARAEALVFYPWRRK